MSDIRPDRPAVKIDALINGEIIRLGVLIVLAVAAFFVTREVAASNRATSLHDAAELFERGQEAMAAGRLDAATEFLRGAAARNRADKRYVLALARALARKGEAGEAHSALLAVRESAPEDPDVNVELARLAAARGELGEATRYYRSALYAPWPVDQAEARRQVRLELVRMLLDHHQTDGVLAELIALRTNLPDDVPHHLETGALFRRAHDRAHALDEYQQVLRLDPDNADALTGAGLSAFDLGNYGLAARYLARAPAGGADVVGARTLTELVRSADPLAGRLGPVERGRRMSADVDHTLARLSTCAAGDPSRPPIADLEPLLSGLRSIDRQLARPATLSQDEIEAGVDLVYRAEQYVIAHCGPWTPLDESLVLIGRQHGAGTP